MPGLRLNDNYNDGLNGKTRYPVIADPDNTDINQVYLDYAGLPDTNVRAGRQSIKLDNVRFIGNVEFRQVMQVFNGVTVENKSLPDTRLYAGYLGRVKTVNTKQHDTDTVLLNARYTLTPADALVGYGYFQDQNDAIASVSGNAGAFRPDSAFEAAQLFQIQNADAAAGDFDQPGLGQFMQDSGKMLGSNIEPRRDDRFAGGQRHQRLSA